MRYYYDICLRSRDELDHWHEDMVLQAGRPAQTIGETISRKVMRVLGVHVDPESCTPFGVTVLLMRVLKCSAARLPFLGPGGPAVRVHLPPDAGVQVSRGRCTAAKYSNGTAYLRPRLHNITPLSRCPSP